MCRFDRNQHTSRPRVSAKPRYQSTGSGLGESDPDRVGDLLSSKVDLSGQTAISASKTPWVSEERFTVLGDLVEHHSLVIKS
jgi:hypothetical protein